MSILQYRVRFIIILLFASFINCGRGQAVLNEFLPDNTNIVYMGRIDFSAPKSPRFWQPGVCFSFRFTGESCEVILEDEELWGKAHNYYELVVDGKPTRQQMKTKRDSIRINTETTAPSHTVTICKNTEANIGYMGVAAIRAKDLLPYYEDKPARDRLNFEFIGNSILCGTGSDQSVVPCGKGEWQDQHNAYMSYGSIVARSFNANVHLSAVSGIGLMHSCCNLDITMPDVIDKVNMRDNRIRWDFSRYQPNLLVISLGQNDGIQDSTSFCGAYLRFIGRMHSFYPNADIVIISSPMADPALREYMRRMLTSIAATALEFHLGSVSYHIFEKQYNKGCDGHPSIEEHQLIADELKNVISQLPGWKLPK